MRRHRRRLAAAEGIRESVLLDEAADVMSTVPSTRMYDLLVVQRNLAHRPVRRFVAETIAADQLPVAVSWAA